MKTKIFSLAILAFCAMFASCDNNDNISDEDISTDWKNPTISNRWTGDNATKWEVVNAYLSDIIIPTYSDLAAASEKLYAASENIKDKLAAGSLTDADIKTACEAFSEARVYWERSEAFLYGAASDYSIDPHIDSWPLDQSQMAGFLTNASMVAGLNSADPIGFVRKNNNEFDTALGFHGIEFVLWRNGQPRPASAFMADETDDEFAGKGVSGATEAAFLVAVAGDLRDHCYELEYAWGGEAIASAHKDRVNALGLGVRAMNGYGYYYGHDLLLSGYNRMNAAYLETTHSNMTSVLSNILVGGCSNICAEVADQKMGQAYRVASGKGEEEDAGDYIESPYSKHSFIDYQGNIYSIKHSLYGSRNDNEASPKANSVLAYLKDAGYGDASKLDNALKNAIAALQTCIDSGVAFVEDPGNARVKNAIDAVFALDDELNNASEWLTKQ